MGAGFSHVRPRKAGEEEEGSNDTGRHCSRPADWSVVQTVDADRWKGPLAERSGFDFPVHWKRKKLRVHKWPWTNFSVTSKEEKMCSFSCCVEDTGRKEKLSNWLKDINIVGFHPRVLVVQLVLNKSLKLLMVDWKKGHLLATYSFYYNGEPCYQECLLSPDASIMVCRQDFYLRRRLHHVTSFDPNIRVNKIKDGLCQRLFVIQDYLALSLSGSGLSFDPRYPEGRLAVLSSTQQTALDDFPNSIRPHRLRVYDLNSQKVVTAAPSVTDKMTHHAVHSPDGLLVAVLGVNASIYINCHIFLSCVDVYCADTLQRLWHFPLQDEPCKINSLHLYPVFSRNGSLLAMCSGEHSRTVLLYQMPRHDHSLKEACRSSILHHTSQEHVHHLPLPKALIEFLLFKK